MISNRDCELDYGALVHFDESIQDLMFKISAKRPTKRHSAKEALLHRVFRELGLVDVGRETGDLEENLYKKYNDLKRKWVDQGATQARRATPQETRNPLAQPGQAQAVRHQRASFG